MFAEIGPPPACVDNSFEDRRFLMTLSKASPRPCPSSAPAEGAADPDSISRRGSCSEKLKSSLFAVLFLFHLHIIPRKLQIIPQKQIISLTGFSQEKKATGYEGMRYDSPGSPFVRACVTAFCSSASRQDSIFLDPSASGQGTTCQQMAATSLRCASHWCWLRVDHMLTVVSSPLLSLSLSLSLSRTSIP